MGQDEQSKRVWDREREAERKRLYRERKRLEQIEELEAGKHALAGAEVDNLVRPGPRIPTEEEYVRHELAVTKAQIERGWIKTRDAKGGDLEPLRRSEEYLRWRYHGFLAGEIASL